MRILVIYAHPVESSFVASIHQRVLETLIDCGHDVEDLDLYASCFNPVLSREEWLVYDEAGNHRRPLEEHFALLKWAEGLIFVYPTWWYGLPAILKGWLERVWLPDITFELSKDDGPIRPLMQNVRWLGGISTYGSPWWWILRVGDPGRQTLLRGVRALCARHCRTSWLAHYDMDHSTANSRASFLSRVDRSLRRIR